MRLVIVLIAAVALLSGCASTVVEGAPRNGPGTFIEQAPSAPPDQLVFQVDIGGGYWQQEYAATARPTLSVYGDSSAYVVIDRSGSSRGAPLQLKRTSVDDLAGLIAAARRTGLFTGDEVDLGEPSITDSASTSVTFRPGTASARSVSAYALQYTDGDDDLTDRQRDGRRALRALVEKAEDAVVSASSTWTPDRIDVTGLPIYTRTSNPQPWPGPALTTLLKATTSNRPCGVISGAAAARIYDTAVQDDVLHWREGAVVRPLAIRALLPGEPGCMR